MLPTTVRLFDHNKHLLLMCVVELQTLVVTTLSAKSSLTPSLTVFASLQMPAVVFKHAYCRTFVL